MGEAEGGCLIMAREVIAHGVGSPEVPTYVTVSAGIPPADPELVHIVTTRGNKVEGFGEFPWQKMHGVRVSYRKYDAEKRTTIYHGNKVTIMATGAWKVEVEPPAE